MASRWRRGSMRSRHWILCLVVVVGGVVMVRPGLAQTSSGTWSTVASMPTPRYALAAVAGADGRIYAIGGAMGLGFSPLSTMEAYTPFTNTWSTRRRPSRRGPALLDRPPLHATGRHTVVDD